jgi:hypothetical protein
MTATTIRQTEGVPEGYPAVTVSTGATPFLPVAWARVESYIALRVTERAVEFVAEGCGQWQAPLRPVTIATTERWNGSAWETAELSTSPLGGYCLPGVGPYRFTGTAGDDDTVAPALLLEAVRRLAEYLAAKPGKPGVRSQSVTAGTVSLSTTRSPTAMAEALQNSGAADLLRNFRRA